jgi:hypothetical protein
MVDSNRMRSLEEHSRHTDEEIQVIRAEVTLQGTELSKKMEQLQVQKDTSLTALNSLKATHNNEGGRR